MPEMQPRIHNTFAVGLQGPEERNAVRDKFRLEKVGDELVVHYRSPNRLCEIYKAIAEPFSGIIETKESSTNPGA
jgi:hypothetical protein